MRFWDFLFLLVVATAAVALTAWIFNAVMAADIPGWLKYVILR